MLTRSHFMLLRRLNWRLMLVQLLLQWCFANGVWQFAFLWDIPLLRLLGGYNPEQVLRGAPEPNISVERLLDYIMVLNAFPYLASLLALLLSLLLFRKKRWYWLSAILPFLVMVGLQYAGLTLRGEFLVGRIDFHRSSPGLRFFGLGLLLLAGGMLLLYAKPIHRFITGRRIA